MQLCKWMTDDGKGDDRYWVIAIEDFGWGRTQDRERKNGYHGRCKSRLRDLSNVERFYCEKMGHYQISCQHMREDIKKLRQNELQ